MKRWLYIFLEKFFLENYTDQRMLLLIRSPFSLDYQLA